MLGNTLMVMKWGNVTKCEVPISDCTRAEVRHSFITTTVREESQVTPQGRHR